MSILDDTPGRPPPIPYRQAPAVLAALLLCVVAITWPWVLHFPSSMAAHWDPPFHAWKLWYVADALLHGHLLPPDANTNMYYPNSCALYYEALHWPQAVFAAVLLPLLHNPVLVYHVTLVFFWALAGLFIWMVLLSLGAKGPAALFGAILFTILPYRTSYYLEFNMQLCFGLTLFLFFLVRYFQRPCCRYACGAATALMLQATSELYQAIFLLLVLPFLLVPLLWGRRGLFRSRKEFLYPALAALAICLVVTHLLLAPYLDLLSSRTLSRSLEEIHPHRLEPLSYLTSLHHCRWRLLPDPCARHDEMSVYPTLAVLLMTFSFLARALRKDIGELRGGTGRERLLPILRVIRAILLAAAIAAGIWLPRMAPMAKPLARLFYDLPLLLCLLSLAICGLARREPFRARFLEGLFSAALFAFFMSLGPNLPGPGGTFLPNALFLLCYGHIPALHGFRVVSRFAIFPLLFATLASSLLFSDLLGRAPGRRWSGLSIGIVLLGLVAFEAIPVPRGFRDAKGVPLESDAFRELDGEGRPYVLAPIPFGDRFLDSMDMLKIGGTTRTLVYAWGGTYPPFTREVLQAGNQIREDPRPLHRLLSELWPDCLLVIAKDQDDLYLRRYGATSATFARHLAPLTMTAAEDDVYTILRLAPLPAQTNFVKLVRENLVRSHDVVSFFAKPAGKATEISVDFNGRRLGSFPIGEDGTRLEIPYGPEGALPIVPNRFTLESSAPFLLSGFELERRGAE